MKNSFVLTCVIAFVAADCSIKKYNSNYQRAVNNDDGIIKFGAEDAIPSPVQLAMNKLLNDVAKINNQNRLIIQSFKKYTHENSVFNVNVVSNSNSDVHTAMVNNLPNVHQINSNPPATYSTEQLPYSGLIAPPSSQPNILPPVASSPAASIQESPISSSITADATSINDINIDPKINLASFTNNDAGQPFIATYNIGSFQGLKIVSANKILNQNNGINNSPGSNAKELTVNNGNKGLPESGN